jgi:hypothetical protein
LGFEHQNSGRNLTLVPEPELLSGLRRRLPCRQARQTIESGNDGKRGNLNNLKDASIKLLNDISPNSIFYNDAKKSKLTL